MEPEGLIVVDVQNDFLPGGKLAVAGGDAVIPLINALMEKFVPSRIFFTTDSHPKSHGSFAANHEGKRVYAVIKLSGIDQVLWPIHCVTGTRGAEINDRVDVPEDAAVIQKGMNPKYDSYSGFKDAGGHETELQGILDAHGFGKGSTLYIAGLATDYCVKATALDAVKLGFMVRVVIDACRGVTPDTTKAAIDEMFKAGVEFVKSGDIKRPVDPR